MTNEFALDLKVARRKSGLTQQDIAHFLDVHPSKISLLESGRSLPSVRDLCTLSLVYGRSLESLFGGIFDDVRRELHERLKSLPEGPKRWIGTFNRQNSLSALAHRLETQSDFYGEET